MSLILLLFVPGCASSSGGSSSPGGAGTGGSRTLKQGDLDVSSRMTRYHNAVAAVGLTQGERAEVNNAYAQYRAAYNEALQAAGNNRNAPAPDNVTELANQVIDALASIP